MTTSDITEDPTVAADDERRERLVTAARLLEAELSVLGVYDDQRRITGHDFGNGQRHAELIRLRREHEHAVAQCHAYGYGMNLGELLATPEQLTAALQRLKAQRTSRYKHRAPGVDYRRTTIVFALDAWGRTAREIEQVVEAREALR
jgi:hypothetical protein